MSDERRHVQLHLKIRAMRECTRLAPVNSEASLRDKMYWMYKNGKSYGALKTLASFKSRPFLPDCLFLVFIEVKRNSENCIVGVC